MGSQPFMQGYLKVLQKQRQEAANSGLGIFLGMVLGAILGVYSHMHILTSNRLG